MYNIKKIILFFTIFLPCLTHAGSKGSKSANITKNTTKPSTIFFQNDTWYVHIPRSAELHSFSKEQIAKIIDSMPLDMKASVLCDAQNLDRVLDFIENNNITPDIVPNTNSSNNSTSSTSSSWQAIMDRARSHHSTTGREKYMKPTIPFSTDRVFSLYYKASKQGLENMRTEIIKELNKHSSSEIDRKKYKVLLVQIDQALHCPYFGKLYFIKHANLDDAINEYRNFTGKLMPANVLGAAEKIIKARPDYQQRLVLNALNSYQSIYQPKFLEIQPMIVEALNPSHDLDMVAQNLGTTVDQVFANADKHNYIIPYEIDLEIQSSLDTLPGIKNAKEFTFEVVKIQHLLSDVQEQTIACANLQPSVIERSPDLLTRAIQEYWKDLAPTENEISLISDLACYISDVTVGTNYLSPEVVEQRVQAFWNGIDKLSFEHISQLTTEDWIDTSAYVAARATWAVGITKTAAVLRNLKNVGTAISGTAAFFADKFVKIFDNVIRGNPTVITADGAVIVNASPVVVAEAAQALYSLNNMQDMGDNKPKIIKDVDGVLGNEKKLTEVTQSTAELRQSILKREKIVTNDNLKPLGFRGDTFKKLEETNLTTGKISINTEMQGNIEKAKEVLNTIKKEFDTRGLIKDGTEPLKNGAEREFYQFKDGSSVQLRTKGKSGHIKVDIIDVFKNIEEKITFK